MRVSAAYFVQSTVTMYEKHIGSSPQDQDGSGKEASNLIVLVSELYNFQVISCILIYDLVRDLLSRPQLSEHNVELLLKVVRSRYLRFPSRHSAKLWKVLDCSSDKMIHPH